MYHLYVNSAGLLLDIIGVCLVFKFGLPEDVRRSGASFLRLENDDPVEAAKAARYDSWARVGLLLLIAGFAVQIISNGMEVEW